MIMHKLKLMCTKYDFSETMYTLLAFFWGAFSGGQPVMVDNY